MTKFEVEVAHRLVKTTYVQVEAEDEEKAMEKAVQLLEEGLPTDWETDEDDFDPQSAQEI
jgi:hypothetical protein